MLTGTIQEVPGRPDMSAILARLDSAEARLAAAEAQLTAIEGGYLDGTVGQATLTSNIGIGATYPVTVPFARPMPDTNYVVLVSIEGGAQLLGVVVPMLPASSKTITSCVVSVKNTGLVTLGLNAVVRVAALKII